MKSNRTIHHTTRLIYTRSKHKIERLNCDKLLIVDTHQTRTISTTSLPRYWDSMVLLGCRTGTNATDQ
jgi:hypothetical protein